MPRIGLQMIKIPQVPIVASRKKKKRAAARGPREASPCGRAKGLVQERGELDLREVPNKEGSAAAARQGIRGDGDRGNPAGGQGLSHQGYPHLLGDRTGGVVRMSRPHASADILYFGENYSSKNRSIYLTICCFSAY